MPNPLEEMYNYNSEFRKMVHQYLKEKRDKLKEFSSDYLKKEILIREEEAKNNCKYDF